MEFLGYLAAVLIGISLGLIGGGGSILTVPVLVYLFGENASTATGYSLFIVGLTALIGSIAFIRRQQVDFGSVVAFGVPSVVGVYLVRTFVMPAIPDELMRTGSFVLTRDRGILLFFALLMLATAISMIRSRSAHAEGTTGEPPALRGYWKVVLEGLTVGAVTGFVGAGGGFLIVPALVLLGRLPMKTAIGTSLMIIAAKSLIGFIGDVQTQAAIDWQLLVSVSASAIAGIAIGTFLATKVPGSKLKPAFGVFVLVMAVFIVTKELLAPGASH
jgi:uncharacterized membrane protein YfcA